MNAKAGPGHQAQLTWQRLQPLLLQQEISVNIDTGTSPDSLRTAATTGTGPFFGCVETAAVGTTGVSVCYDGEFTTTANGAIEPNQVVVSDTAIAGRVIGRAAEASNRVVGIYLRHQGRKIREFKRANCCGSRRENRHKIRSGERLKWPK